MAPVGGVGAVGVWRRRGAGVVAGGLGERGEARGQGTAAGRGSTAGGGANGGSSGRSEGSRGSFSSVCGLESGMTHYKEHNVR